MSISLTKENHEREVSQSKMPIIIDVFASWCGPCQQMEPVFAELENELKDKIKFLKLNVDEARDLSIHYGVTSVPTFIFIKDGEVKTKETGYMSKEDLKEKLLKILG